MRFNIMRQRNIVQVWDKEKSEWDYKIIKARKPIQIEYKPPVVGYRISISGVQPIFVRKYSQAIGILCQFKNVGAKIEAVR